MPRSRVERHVDALFEWGIEVQSGDMVTIFASPPSQAFVNALHAKLGRIGAEPVTITGRPSSNIGVAGEHIAAFLANYDGTPTTPDHLQALVEASDAFIVIGGATNMHSTGRVPRATQQQRGKAMGPIMDTMMGSEQAVLVVHPTDAYAQHAGMSLPEFEDFVYQTSLRDWAAQNTRQERMRERLAAAEEARIVGPDTDLTLSLAGMCAINDIGDLNFPPGEVYTAPVLDSVNGVISFDKPTMMRGSEVEDIHLSIEDGTVRGFSARRNEAALKSVLETDAGSERIGEFGIGMNDAIDRVTGHISFDEKMGGTIHLALGRAYAKTVGAGREQNQSAVHIDLIKGMGESRLELDDDVVQENGEFVVE
jgi:aminopeptidase